MNRARMTGQAGPDPQQAFAGPAPSRVQELLDMGAVPAQEFVAQAGRAGTSIAEAQSDPTLANVTNAGVQTGMAFGRPVVAAGAGAAGLLEAMRRDVMGSGGAQASDNPLNDAQQKTYDRLLRKSRSKAELSDAEEKQLDALNQIITATSIAKATAGTKAQESRLANEEAQRASDAKRKADEDAAARARAGQAYQAGLATDRRFSDTEVGKVFDKFGPVAPGVAAAGAGLLSGMGVRGAGIVNNVARYGIPTGVGAVTGVTAAHWPQAYEANYAPNINPSYQAATNYVREAPADDPRAAQLSGLLQSGAIEKANPVRTEAEANLYDPKKFAERSVLGLLEGVAGGFAGGEAPSAAKYMLKSLPKAAEEVGKLPGSLWKGITGGFASSAPKGGAGGTGGSQGGQQTNVPPNPLSNTQGKYPAVGSPERSYIRDEYRRSVLDGGAPLNPSGASKIVQQYAKDQGGRLPNLTGRVGNTNASINEFVAQNGRMPISQQEWAQFIYRNTGTLGLLGLMGASQMPTE